MFHTDIGSELPLPDEFDIYGEKTWWYVKKKLYMYWFHVVCELTYEDDIRSSEMYFINQIDHLLLLEKRKDLRIIQIDLVSPSHMNGEKRWKMEPLSKIMVGEEIVGGNQQEMMMFELTNGRQYVDSGDSANAKNIVEPRVIFSVKEPSFDDELCDIED